MQLILSRLSKRNITFLPRTRIFDSSLQNNPGKMALSTWGGKSIFDFSGEDLITGNHVHLKQYQGKCALVLNVATF